MSRAVLPIIARELRAVFLAPVGYLVAIVFLVMTGWLFMQPFFLNDRADLRQFFELLPLTLALLVPAVTMRSFAEEFSTGSFEALVTLPVTRLDVLIGKFTGAIGFVALALAPTVLYPIVIARLGDLDWGPVVAGYAGAVLLIGLYCAAGLLASALTRNQIVAFVIGLAIALSLALIDDLLIYVPGRITAAVQYLGADYHFRSIARGVLDSRDLVYFLSGIAVFLTGTGLALRRRS